MLNKINIIIGLGLIIILSIIMIIMIAQSKPAARKYSIVCVPSEDVAKKLADVICKAAYPDIDFSMYEAKAFQLPEEKNVWTISYAPPVGDNKFMFGGGGPAILINAETAEVIKIYLQE